jgi:2-dehydro-3-deoxyphosphogluconate aldolase/(4S)-4-hydroxy-2-oxoglutarate aldolase
MTVPGALDVIAELSRTTPQLIVGAGTVLDVGTAKACIDAGAAFVTSPGLNTRIVEFTASRNTIAIPGALTPTEIMAASDAGADLIKVFPCDAVGGAEYLRSLRAPFPHLDFIAAGGVDQVNAADFIRAGAAAVGIRGRLMPPEAIERRDQNWIRELSGRFLGIVQKARAESTRESGL